MTKMDHLRSHEHTLTLIMYHTVVIIWQSWQNNLTKYFMYKVGIKNLSNIKFCAKVSAIIIIARGIPSYPSFDIFLHEENLLVGEYTLSRVF